MRILVEILIKTLLGEIFSISLASFWLLRFEVEALIEQECSIAALNRSTPETPTPEFTVSSESSPSLAVLRWGTRWLSLQQPINSE